jgi:hypothetical protein
MGIILGTILGIIAVLYFTSNTKEGLSKKGRESKRFESINYLSYVAFFLPDISLAYFRYTIIGGILLIISLVCGGIYLHKTRKQKHSIYRLLAIIGAGLSLIMLAFYSIILF